MGRFANSLMLSAAVMAGAGGCSFESGPNLTEQAAVNADLEDSRQEMFESLDLLARAVELDTDNKRSIIFEQSPFTVITDLVVESSGCQVVFVDWDESDPDALPILNLSDPELEKNLFFVVIDGNINSLLIDSTIDSDALSFDTQSVLYNPAENSWELMEGDISSAVNPEVEVFTPGMDQTEPQSVAEAHELAYRDLVRECFSS